MYAGIIKMMFSVIFFFSLNVELASNKTNLWQKIEQVWFKFTWLK